MWTVQRCNWTTVGKPGVKVHQRCRSDAEVADDAKISGKDTSCVLEPVAMRDERTETNTKGGDRLILHNSRMSSGGVWRRWVAGHMNTLFKRSCICRPLNRITTQISLVMYWSIDLLDVSNDSGALKRRKHYSFYMVSIKGSNRKSRMLTDLWKELVLFQRTYTYSQQLTMRVTFLTTSIHTPTVRCAWTSAILQSGLFSDHASSIKICLHVAWSCRQYYIHSSKKSLLSSSFFL